MSLEPRSVLFISALATRKNSSARMLGALDNAANSNSFCVSAGKFDALHKA
jgi:hypothetical protein